MDLGKDREMFAGAIGAVMLAEILGLVLSDVHTSSSVVNVIVSLLGHAALLLYFLGNRLERNKAIIAGLLTLLSVANNAILGGAISESAIRAAALGSAVCIIPALAVTVLLFAGVLDYGN